MQKIADMKPEKLHHALLQTAHLIERLFANAEVKEAIREAQRCNSKMSGFSIFATTIAPVLFAEKRQDATGKILTAFGSNATGELAIRDAYELFMTDADFVELISYICQLGADKVAALLYMHGPPPVPGAISAVLKDRAQQETWQAYMANVSCLLLKAWCSNNKTPLYTDIIKKNARTSNDDRTGRDILESLKKQFRRRKEQRRPGIERKIRIEDFNP